MTTKEYIKQLKMELLILMIGQSMFYGDFKVETKNEEEWFKLMKALNLWINDEDKAIAKIESLKGEIKAYET